MSRRTGSCARCPAARRMPIRFRAKRPRRFPRRRPGGWPRRAGASSTDRAPSPGEPFMPPITRVLSLLLSCMLLPAAVAMAAETYPAKPIRLIVPFPPGGPADALARIVGDRIGANMGKPVVVENRPGAGGNIGMEMGAKAAPDGYTLVLAPA